LGKNSAFYYGKGVNKRMSVVFDEITMKKIINVKADYLVTNKKQISLSKIITMLIRESPKISEQDDVTVRKK